jgi:hypothetical protein
MATKMYPEENTHYLAQTESISILERVILWAFTGDRSKLPSRLLDHIGMFRNMMRHGWPAINRDVLDLDTFHIQLKGWPMDRDIPYFSQIAALKKHFGENTANAQRTSLATLVLPPQYMHTVDGCIDALKGVFNDFYVPQMRQFMVSHLELRQKQIDKLSNNPPDWATKSGKILDSLRGNSPFSRQ